MKKQTFFLGTDDSFVKIETNDELVLLERGANLIYFVDGEKFNLMEIEETFKTTGVSFSKYVIVVPPEHRKELSINFTETFKETLKFNEAPKEILEVIPL